MLNIRNLVAVLCASLALTVGSQRAHSNQYEVFVDISTEEDLYDLQVAGIIDDITFETLVELLQRGVNLNTASRKTLYNLPNLTYAEVDAILAYRDEVGRIADPITLVDQGILRADKLSAIAAFLVIRTGANNKLPASGMMRVQTRYSVEDSGAPASALQLRAQGLQNISIGMVALNTRLEIGEVRYDAVRQALSAEAPKNKAQLPKLYVQWEGESLSAIAGTYRIGFGQRLTFDNSDQTDPDGFYGDSDVFRGSDLTRDCKESAGELDTTPCPSDSYTYVTPDFRSRDGLTGVAASLREVEVGGGLLEMHGFLSYQPRSIYQYELYNPAVCDDPRSEDAACSAPDVFRTGEAPLQPASEFSFQTLPDMYAEKIAGANVSYSQGRRSHVGVTGYASQVDWLVEGMELDFQEWSSLPYGGSFGAVGVDAAKGFGYTDVLAEVTRTFDGMPGGGGLGALGRAITAWKKNEIETSVRYYAKNFANPHARPIAAADEYDGLRARDEIGGRVQYTGEFDKRFRVRTKLDYWHTPSESRNAIQAFVRGDVEVTDQFQWGLWTLYQDKDLSRGGRDECYEGTDDDEIGPNGPLTCAGQKMQATGRLRFSPSKTTWFDLQGQLELQDDGASQFTDKYRKDVSIVGIATTKPHPRLRIRARTRFLYEDITASDYLEKSWWSYADISYRLRRRDQLKFRYDLVMHLDDRSATLTRTPNPEHWMRLEYAAHF
ncbi:MAG: helix-hairpin-helix domain-containing protein [Myxococcales bacterium]|nr:helix-hairpin-helix domain-containing protein [Myxococcales bacterium]